jgi:hypothetical protein
MPEQSFDRMTSLYGTMTLEELQREFSRLIKLAEELDQIAVQRFGDEWPCLSPFSAEQSSLPLPFKGRRLRINRS